MTAAAFVSFGALAAGPALAAQDDSLATGEAVAVVLFDQSMNLLSAVAELQGCTAAAGRYPFVAEVTAEGSGRAQFDKLLMTVDIERARQRGMLVAVRSASPAAVAGSEVRELAASVGFSQKRQMVVAQSNFTLGGHHGGTIDYTDRVIGGSAGVAGHQRTDGMEETSIVLMRQQMPSSRWQHTFSYARTTARHGEYRSVRERRQARGGEPCVLASDDVVTRIDAHDGRVRMYGAVTVGVDAATARSAPLRVDSADDEASPGLMATRWAGDWQGARSTGSDASAGSSTGVRIRIWAVGD